MNKQMITLFAVGITALSLNQAVSAQYVNDANTLHSPLVHGMNQEVLKQPSTPLMLAAGIDTRVERRSDAVENTADRVDDNQDFREERRDCVGDGPDCRSDNRQDKRHDTADRAEDRVDDRRDRR